mgnify:CR=1 FL=1
MAKQTIPTHELFRFTDLDPQVIEIAAKAGRQLAPANEQYVVEVIGVLEQQALQGSSVAADALGVLIDLLVETKEGKEGK